MEGEYDVIELINLQKETIVEDDQIHYMKEDGGSDFEYGRNRFFHFFQKC